FTEQRGVLRGCVDRLLLFGLDDDVRSVLSAYTSQRVCRETNRKILRLYPLSTDSDVKGAQPYIDSFIRVWMLSDFGWAACSLQEDALIDYLAGFAKAFGLRIESQHKSLAWNN
ncbi:hypothetical protein TELCIR_17067, partial [Teladorsagia circumcincta]